MISHFSEAQILFLALGALGLGIYLLVRGGDLTINSAVYVAQKFGVPPLLVGFTIVGFGTSLPEMIVAINANLKGSGDLAIGNVLGSNIANILLVLGTAAIFTPLIAKPKELWRDMVMMIGASLLFTGLMAHGVISSLAGGIMLAILVAYIVWQYFSANKNKDGVSIAVPQEDDEFENLPKSLISASFTLFIGLTCIALGAEFLVQGAHTSALIVGIPDAVIGLTIVAIGTSLPELATAIAAARQKQTGILLGNIIGSNVFNILSIIGIAALFKPFGTDSMTQSMLNFDAPVMLGVAVLFTLIVMIFKKINKLTGAFMLGLYALYIFTLVALHFDNINVPL